MTSARLTQPPDVADVLRARIRSGHGLSVPYARRWDVGGCEPTHSVRSYPYDGLLVLGTGLVELGHPVVAAPDGVAVQLGVASVWVAANRSVRGEGPPDAYLVGLGEKPTARFVVDTAEVVVELVAAMSAPPPELPVADVLRVGFPGLTNTKTTYVGSWQWDVHGEATDDEFVRRGASATLAAIDAKKVRDARHPD